MSNVVMIPCPEEHVAELRLILMRMSMGMGNWSADSAAPFVQDLTADQAALIRLVAQRSLELDRVPYRSAAQVLDIDTSDVLDMVTDINDRCVRVGLSALVITDTAREKHDGVERAVPVLVIVKPVAQLLLEMLAAEGREPG